jgi:hypothetical protein
MKNIHVTPLFRTLPIFALFAVSNATPLAAQSSSDSSFQAWKEGFEVVRSAGGDYYIMPVYPAA